jgi:hypothetical protein
VGIDPKVVGHATPPQLVTTTPTLMGSPSPTVESESDYIIRKFVWHSSDVAHVEAKIFELCKGDFGIPKHHHSAPVKSSNGSIPISNAIFLPSPGEPLEDYHWDITGKSGPPPLPDYRELWVHETNSNADGLSRARTPLELCMTVGHAMLGTPWNLPTDVLSSVNLPP